MSAVRDGVSVGRGECRAGWLHVWEGVGLLSPTSTDPISLHSTLATATQPLHSILGKLGSDREERAFVPYQRSARLLQLSTHSAEQAASTLHFLKLLAQASCTSILGKLHSILGKLHFLKLPVGSGARVHRPHLTIKYTVDSTKWAVSRDVMCRQ